MQLADADAEVIPISQFLALQVQGKIFWLSFP